MEEMLSLSALAIVATLCAVVVRRQVAELGLVLALVAGGCLIIRGFTAFAQVQALMVSLADTAGLSPAVLSPVFKTVGIALLTHLTAALCKDANEGGIAAFVEVAGTATALAVALPLLQAVLDTVLKLLK